MELGHCTNQILNSRERSALIAFAGMVVVATIAGICYAVPKVVGQILDTAPIELGWPDEDID